MLGSFVSWLGNAAHLGAAAGSEVRCKEKARVQILVIPRNAVPEDLWPQGFAAAGTPAVAAALHAITTSSLLVERTAAECEPAWKQPIPYCMLVRDAEVFCVERLPRQGEGRLHGRLSVGLGGHVEAADTTRSSDPVRAALERELQEEVAIVGPSQAPQFLGLVNDDADAVGRVHFGLVFRQRVPSGGAVQIVESSKMRGGFRHLAGPGGLWQDRQRFESWSRILLEARAVAAVAR